MKKTRILAVIVCMMATVNTALADNVRGINIDFVTIGNAGNPGDTRTIAHPNGCGSVGYNYRIGKYEVTNAQWNTFTTATGAPTGNPSNAYDGNAAYIGNFQPTNCVSWYEVAQFCNYLTSGYKGLGAYQLGTDGSITVNRDVAVSAYGTIYVIPTENEWYKAAYFKPDASGYSTYANGTDTAPIVGVQSNYHSDSPWNVGTGTPEQNGTYDMMGNVLEWNETLIEGVRGARGGWFDAYFSVALAPSSQSYYYPQSESTNLGFRVAEVVPEPATILLLTLGGLALRRKH
jgi:formylglycine-generating enzyme required for sulfatase activity